MSNQNKYPFHWEFTPANDGSFTVPHADHLPVLYFPLMNSYGMKSYVTPDLKGDMAASFHKYLTAATVTEELHRNSSGRNFWITTKGQVPWSATGNSVYQKAQQWTGQHDEYTATGQFGAFTTRRQNKKTGIETAITVFVPETNDFVELVKITVKNTGKQPVTFVGTYAIPVFGRSADNFRDHRQVTTMFQENYIEKHGVRIKPRIEHDEKGHTVNNTNYVVLGFDNEGNKPSDIWIRVHDFIGEGGSLDNPQAVFENTAAPVLTEAQANASEAIGAFRFDEITLKAGQTTDFVIAHGITNHTTDINKWELLFGTPQKAEAHLKKTLTLWKERVNTVTFSTADTNYNNWVKWVSFQVKCRQIFGNSYLPDFGYGRGGRGWRDLWQDLLSIFLVDPESAKNEMLNNFKGIRIDGSNATIIGTQPGEFLADRNNIPRTWSDHGAWPVFILNFYLNQTGDFQILFDETTYWKDRFSHRNRKIDEHWTDANGYQQRDASGRGYTGTLFEHVLLQQLSAFFNVGEHNILLLEGADWNDTYDMARERGESVCFHNFYAYNFELLANILEHLKQNGTTRIELLKEILLLLDRVKVSGPVNYNSPEAKRQRLKTYFDAVEKTVSGKKVSIQIDDLIADLKTKAAHIAETIRKQEWLNTNEGHQFFNGHYDNLGQPIGGDHTGQTRMDLTSQVMPIICNIAQKHHATATYKAIKAILKDEDSPAIRLTTEFKDVDMNIGRITGFVYGHKEHGSKWMQQNIMLAYGLYKQGLVEQGHEVLSEVYEIANNQPVAKIFPGIPSYFNAENRGAYAYLTGSSSWFLLTLTTQVFGVRGEKGNLCIQPKLMQQQFDANGEATIALNFQNKRLLLTFQNPQQLDYGNYRISQVTINGKPFGFELLEDNCMLISKNDINQELTLDENSIVVMLNTLTK